MHRPVSSPASGWGLHSRWAFPAGSIIYGYEAGADMSHLTITDHDDVVVVRFNNVKILDEGVIRQIGSEFEKLTTEAAAERKLLLNFERVTFMSSAMIG